MTIILGALTPNAGIANLSAYARGRYECKVISSGLNTDRYAIDDCYWTEVPEIVPDVQWSDMMLYDSDS